jgi:mRNA-degrading endonuclease RelE of RelBE toxin-antitoxin system
MAQRVLAAVRRYADTTHGDIKRLTGVDPPEWRLRVGDYRVLLRFEQERDERTRELVDVIRILRVRHRREAYWG